MMRHDNCEKDHWLCHQTSYLIFLFRQRLFPNWMKVAKVIPLFKTGDKHRFTNYRPVSLLSQFFQSSWKNICTKIRRVSSRQQLIEWEPVWISVKQINCVSFNSTCYVLRTNKQPRDRYSVLDSRIWKSACIMLFYPTMDGKYETEHSWSLTLILLLSWSLSQWDMSGSVRQELVSYSNSKLSNLNFNFQSTATRMNRSVPIVSTIYSFLNLSRWNVPCKTLALLRQKYEPGDSRQ